MKIYLDQIFLEGHFIRYPESFSLQIVARHIRNVIGLSGLYEHRVSSGSAPSYLTKHQMKLLTLFLHMLSGFFGNFDFPHLFFLLYPLVPFFNYTRRGYQTKSSEKRYAKSSGGEQVKMRSERSSQGETMGGRARL